MKKSAILLILVLVIVMVVVITFLNRTPKEEVTNDNTDNYSVSESTIARVDVNNTSVRDVFHTATSENYATVKVDSKIKMDDESAWLGLVPQGKDYITELEADEVDIIWWQVDARENEDDPYVWACDFENVEDGKYDVVVATSDDENVGYVAIQLSMEKKGEKITFDFENAKIKERPTTK